MGGYQAGIFTQGLHKVFIRALGVHEGCKSLGLSVVGSIIREPNIKAPKWEPQTGNARKKVGF